jgi:putative glutathione S-transferase
MKGVANTVDMDQIKEHYYCSHPDLNKLSIVARGPNFIKLLEEPHNRGSVFDDTKRAEYCHAV